MASRRVRARRRRSQPRIFLRLFLIGLGATLILAAVGTTLGFATVQSWLQDLPDATKTKVAQATKIYSADGKLIARLYLEDREVVPLADISPNLQKGVVAVEDERFYEHRGYDVPGIIRAAVTDVMSGSAKEGASTLTQQYIRQTVLSNEATQVTFARKVREIYLAQEVEKRFSKDEILAMYLNTVYYGDGAYGAEAAAKHFFNKPAKNLTLAEAAVLAGLPQSPYRLNPFKGSGENTATIERQRHVLATMLDNGFITTEQYQQAIAEKVVFHSAPQTKDGIYDCPYFVAYIKKQLQDMYGTSVVFKGGLKVYTTIDTRMQHIAERARDDNLGEPGDPSVALVSIDPRSGYIKAMVGGKDYNTQKFNLASQGKRQPGSSFKTFTLVTALEKGIPPYRAFDSGSPADIPQPNGAPDWVVQNSEGKGEGYISLEKATANSVNCVFARLIHEIGAANVAATAKRMGITTKIPAIDSITLGAQNCTPLEMASAYGTLATNGVHATTSGIIKVLGSDGKVMYDNSASHIQRKQAVSRQVAYAATQILKGVIDHGTGTSADIGRPEAGKTGTSENYRDAWFVGYTPQLVTSVWVGYTTERPMLDVHGQRGFGGTLAAPIWADFMSAVLDDEPKLDFTKAPKPDYEWNDDWSREHTEEKPKKEEDLKPKITPAPTKPGTTKPAPPSNGGSSGGSPKPKPGDGDKPSSGGTGTPSP